MDKTQQAAQLRLAADILETGHPWKWQTSDGEWVKPTIRTELSHVISDGLIIRLILATPPDGRALHNPDNLTAEQVGAGYRLPLYDEATNININAQERLKGGYWRKSGTIYRPTFGHPTLSTYRLPLSIPWPEVEKPEPTPKTVPFEPEDVPPGSVFRSKDQPATTFWTVSQVGSNGFYLRGALVDWLSAERRMEINRSIPLTGRWNPSAWEPCSKPA